MIKVALPSIFFVAIFLRFLYFPQNIYFGFDQARDAFATREILSGQPKLIGPSTTFEGLRHGVLYYYLYTPLYGLGKGNPEVVAGFLRITNAAGTFLIFAIGTTLFNSSVGLIVASLFALSFEQTQFALYLNHPSLAVMSILLMYWGLAILIFKKKNFGLMIASLGLGLSIQFEFILTYLIIPFVLILFIFRKSISFSPKTIILSCLIFFFTILTFIIAEIKFSFRAISSLYQLLFKQSEKSLDKIAASYLIALGQMIKFNLSSISQLRIILGLVLFSTFIMSLFSSTKKQIIFLGVWFFSASIVYVFSRGEDSLQYHPNVGVSLSLLIFVAYLIYLLGKRSIFLPLLLLAFISWQNLSLIHKVNPFGSMPEINVQSFMLLSDEKKVLDYIYEDAKGKSFAVKAITLPFDINTTWSYLFQWHGQSKYGFLPVWGGKAAAGYPGNLTVVEAQDKLPDNRYLIIEPTKGIPQNLIESFLREESYFSNLIMEKKIGEFRVQKRIKK